MIGEEGESSAAFPLEDVARIELEVGPRGARHASIAVLSTVAGIAILVAGNVLYFSLPSGTPR